VKSRTICCEKIDCMKNMKRKKRNATAIWMSTSYTYAHNRPLKTGLNVFFLFGIVEQTTKRQQIRNYI